MESLRSITSEYLALNLNQECVTNIGDKVPCNKIHYLVGMRSNAEISHIFNVEEDAKEYKKLLGFISDEPDDDVFMIKVTNKVFKDEDRKFSDELGSKLKDFKNRVMNNDLNNIFDEII